MGEKFAFLLVNCLALYSCSKVDDFAKAPQNSSVPVSGQWKKITDFPGAERYTGTAFTLNNEGYVGLGHNELKQLKDFWKYNQSTNTWTQVEDFGGIARAAYPTTFVIDSAAYVGFGASNGADPFSPYLDDLWCYGCDKKIHSSSRINSKTWIEKASLEVGNKLYTSSFVIGKSAFIIGGYGKSGFENTVWQYNSDKDSWIKKSNFPGALRDVASAFSIGEKGYVALGNTSSFHLKDFWEYNPLNDQWTQKSDFPGTARWGAMTFVINGKAYIGMGADSETDFWSFDPTTNQWNYETKSPVSGSFGGVCFVINDVAYMGGGSLKEFWAYKP